MHVHRSPITLVGNYRLTAFSRVNPQGLYAASLSIKRGHGQTSTDRVFRFLPLFDTADAALAHAQAQGQQWAAQGATH